MRTFVLAVLAGCVAGQYYPPGPAGPNYGPPGPNYGPGGVGPYGPGPNQAPAGVPDVACQWHQDCTDNQYCFSCAKCNSKHGSNAQAHCHGCAPPGFFNGPAGWCEDRTECVADDISIDDTCPTELYRDCGENEVYQRCSTLCEPTCKDNLNFPPQCAPGCDKPKCQCLPGYLRREGDHHCVRVDECSAVPAEGCTDSATWDKGYGDCTTYAQGEPNHQYCATDGANVVGACPVACDNCPIVRPTGCADSTTWDKGYGKCDTYEQGKANHPYCVQDGAIAPNACPKACDTCPVDPRACADSTSWDAGYGKCATYARGQPNHQYCAQDRADAPNACPDSCGMCPTGPVVPPPCADSTTFDAGYGACSTYARGQPNHQYCAQDRADAPSACPVACDTCPGAATPPRPCNAHQECMDQDHYCFDCNQCVRANGVAACGSCGVPGFRGSCGLATDCADNLDSITLVCPPLPGQFTPPECAKYFPTCPARQQCVPMPGKQCAPGTFPCPHVGCQ